MADSKANSPLMTADTEESLYDSGSPLSSVLLKKAEGLSPRKQDIATKRDALLGAYRNLIAAQQNRKLPVKDPGMWAAGAAGLMESLDPNMRAFGAGQEARMKMMMGLHNQETEDLRNQAMTNLKMNADDLGFLEKDQATELDLIKQASLADYRDETLQMKMLLASLKAQGEAPETLVPDSEQTSSIAVEMGVPAYSGPNPYEGLDKVGQRQLRMKYEKELDALKDSANENAPSIGRMKRFQQLNEETKDDLLGPGPITDYLPNWSDSMKEMEAIAAEMTPQMRVPGSGASSDKDVDLFKKGMVGTGKGYETNKNIAAAYIVSKENESAKADFLESYLSANGHLRGADQEWKKYLEANPIFDHSPKNKDKYVLNGGRQTWQDYFSKGGVNDSADSDAPKKPVELSREMPPTPPGYTDEKWTKVWNKMSAKDKALFVKGGQ